MIDEALSDARPDTAVRRAVASLPAYTGRLVLIAAGKAAWQMARAASDSLGGKIGGGVVITKYGHSEGEIPPLTVLEAGHPVPDGNSFRAAQAAVDAVKNLQKEDLVLFLLSGGASALFEKPLLPAAEIEDVTRRLLACGAEIGEINILRKRFSGVKGGKFARLCAPARVYSVLLSDVVGDRPDMIGSGPTCPDPSTSEEALTIAEKYGLCLGSEARALLEAETPKALPNAGYVVTGSVRQLCLSAARTAENLGYAPLILTDSLGCEAREAGRFMASVARFYAEKKMKTVLIAGGETVVHLTGKGLGGRNQEFALAAAAGIAGLENALIFALGSDGTDGPTDAAGGIVDGTTAGKLKSLGMSLDAALRENDSYHALKAADALLFTGPTGTNVNDLYAALIDGG